MHGGSEAGGATTGGQKVITSYDTGGTREGRHRETNQKINKDTILLSLFLEENDRDHSLSPFSLGYFMEAKAALKTFYFPGTNAIFLICSLLFAPMKVPAVSIGKGQTHIVISIFLTIPFR